MKKSSPSVTQRKEPVGPVSPRGNRLHTSNHHGHSYASCAGTQAVSAGSRPSKIPAPGAPDAEGLRLELRQTKAALEEAVQRCTELQSQQVVGTGTAPEIIEEASVACVDAATSPVPTEVADHEVQASMSMPPTASPHVRGKPSGCTEVSTSSRAAATAVRNPALAISHCDPFAILVILAAWRQLHHLSHIPDAMLLPVPPCQLHQPSLCLPLVLH